MAVTNNKKQEETAYSTQKVQSSQPYNGMQGVSQNTANNLGNYQQGYKQSDAVNTAQQNLQAIQAQKPQGYTSKYQPQMESIMQQIQNPQDMRYEFNADNLFKAYADLYHQNAKQASMDAMGQAAGLTGGYGNSYAQAVATQQYQQNMLPLYDMGLQLAQLDYQKKQDQLGNQKDLYNIMANADQTDYGRYRDTLGDWQNEEAQAYDRLMQQQEFDYKDYMNNLDYFTQLAQAENQAYNTDRSMNEQIKQNEIDNAYRQNAFDWQKETDARDYAENVRQANINNDYRYATLAEDARQADQNDAYRYAAMAEDARQADQNLTESKRSTDLDEAYRRDNMAWNQETDARDFAEQQKRDDQALAYKYVTGILANGQMPTNELLAMAGLSPQDAAMLMAQIQEMAGGAGGNGNEKGPGLLETAKETGLSEGLSAMLKKYNQKWLKG